MKKTAAIIVILILTVIGIYVFHPIGNVSQNTTAVQPTTAVKETKITTISYRGQNGIDALTLLKNKATVEHDHSGLIVSINGNKPTGHSYWAFYVNGKLASFGPEQYITKNSDTIQWKIEKY